MWKTLFVDLRCNQGWTHTLKAVMILVKYFKDCYTRRYGKHGTIPRTIVLIKVPCRKQQDVIALFVKIHFCLMSVFIYCFKWFFFFRLLRNSQKNVYWIIVWLLFCYNIAIIQIIVELWQNLYLCNETFRLRLFLCK